MIIRKKRTYKPVDFISNMNYASYVSEGAQTYNS